jgi:protease IV
MSSQSPAPGQGPAQPWGPPPRVQGRGLSFYLAWIFGILLFIGGGFGILLIMGLAVLAAGGAGAGLGTDDSQISESYYMGDHGAKTRIALIPIHGAIGMGGSRLLSSKGTELSSIRQYLRRAEADDDVVAVILHINSPGGTVTDSDAIHDLIQRFRTRSGKPVSAYFHAVAASGGYYVAMASEHITAQPTGLVGSIGVILGTFNYNEAMGKLGVKRVTILSPHTPFKDILSPARPMREEERSYLTSMVEEMYQGFVDVVDAGRPGLDREAVQKLADGKIYTARDAQKRGLVDALGSIEDAFDWMKNKVGQEDLELVLYGPPETLMELLGLEGRSQKEVSEAVKSLAGGLQQFSELANPSPQMKYLWTGSR